MLALEREQIVSIGFHWWTISFWQFPTLYSWYCC